MESRRSLPLPVSMGQVEGAGEQSRWAGKGQHPAHTHRAWQSCSDMCKDVNKT